MPIDNRLSKMLGVEGSSETAMIGPTTELAIEEIVPVACFNAWGCTGFEGWVVEHGAPLLITLLGALIVNRWRDLLLVAFVAMTGAVAASSALIYLHAPTGRWGVSTLVAFGPNIVFGYFVFLTLAALVHAPKRWVAGLFARA